VDQVPEKRQLEGVPLGLQRLPVTVDELKRQRLERRSGLAHGRLLPFGVVSLENLSCILDKDKGETISPVSLRTTRIA
jgi:hypothetical protein